MIAGRDVTGGGTWLGITRSGRMAALTNYRDPVGFRADAPSRGSLVANFLQGTQTAYDYLQSVVPGVAHYNAFNLLVFDGAHMMGMESRHARILPMPVGIGAVSNADFMSPWPKVEKLCDGMAVATGLSETAQDHLLWDLLSDAQKAPDDQLPHTGIPLQRERELSSAFIATADYGTRASTILKVGSKGLWIEERRFDSTGYTGTSKFTT